MPISALSSLPSVPVYPQAGEIEPLAAFEGVAAGTTALGAQDRSMPWPALVLGGIGLGALAARSGLRALRASGVKMNFNMPAFSMGGGLQGFEQPMSRGEAPPKCRTQWA